ncbi:hypothetical protein KO493_05320 [Tamlana agarivorans]|uniref:Uncharacterized protein n=1 Tax=Pseudotamlana agarivorans TaxID=481183 RepID=A0ACC5U737_9FLAO|nr:DUF6503 family protein [Tamlana agarivorans]MBU2950114.1 hypothetical protein [Tamlana agarivorans]
MKNFIYLFIAASIFSCKDVKKETVETPEATETEAVVVESNYPEALVKVFEAHGGLDQWKKMRFLEFTMKKNGVDEVTSTDLWNRKSLVETPDHKLGYDGKQVWLQNKNDTEYKGKPKFYYNLMSYFYAMPFILADDGIVYSDIAPLVFEGKTYPGIKVGYESGVGESPEDEYALYYNPDTYKMEWLGYTVTFFTKEKAKEWHFRKYSEWEEFNGVLLPKTIVRYEYENNLPTTVHSENNFYNVKLTKEQVNQDIFELPEDAQLVE